MVSMSSYKQILLNYYTYQVSAVSTPKMEAQIDTSVTHSPTLRKTTTDNTKPRVMFTGVVDEQGEKVGCLVFVFFTVNAWGYCRISFHNNILKQLL